MEDKILEAILDYLDELENDSFEGWSKDEIRGYVTCLNSIKYFIKEHRD